MTAATAAWCGRTTASTPCTLQGPKVGSPLLNCAWEPGEGCCFPAVTACLIDRIVAGSTVPWMELTRGSGSAVAWAAASPTFAVLHMPKVLPALSPAGSHDKTMRLCTPVSLEGHEKGCEDLRTCRRLCRRRQSAAGESRRLGRRRWPPQPQLLPLLLLPPPARQSRSKQHLLLQCDTFKHCVACFGLL